MILPLARQIGLSFSLAAAAGSGDDIQTAIDLAEQAIRQAILDEREACAKVLDDAAEKLETGSTPGLHLVPRGYAQEIRNRK